MTIVVLWYREKYDQLWCAADSRISTKGATTTDSGPKVLPVPVACRIPIAEAEFAPLHTLSFGFAFAGSTLSAISTHALATACTQNLAAKTADQSPPSLAAVANLFRCVGEHYVKDMSSRMAGNSANVSQYFFEAVIFGFCPVKKAFQGFAIAPNLTGPEFQMVIGELVIRPKYFHPMGSGAERFVELSRKLDQTHKNPGVITTLREMLATEEQPDVGGHFQIGIARRQGFELWPILNLAPGLMNRTVTFLGWDVDAIGLLDGYRIGYQAFSPDVD